MFLSRHWPRLNADDQIFQFFRIFRSDFRLVLADNYGVGVSETSEVVDE